MTSLPREVHEVLEDEFVSMYGPLPYGQSEEYTSEQVLDAGAVLATLGEYCPDKQCEDPVRLLEELRCGSEDLADRFAKSPTLRAAHALAHDGTPAERARLNRRILDDVLAGHVQTISAHRLQLIYREIHRRAKNDRDQQRTAFCISGGGIRSATFALGVIQGLASAKVLKKFDYLSTVSGGGYIGSWLSSWARRHPEGIAGVERELGDYDSATAPKEIRSKLEPEPKPVRHLRDYSNYLTPKLGLFSADTWSIFAMYLRNLVLNWAVLVPLIAFALAAPRISAWFLMNAGPEHLKWVVGVTSASLLIGFGFLSWMRPVKHGAEGDSTLLRHWVSLDLRFIVAVVIPLWIAACGLCLFWALEAQYGVMDDRISRIAAVVLGLAMVGLPVFLYMVRYILTPFSERREAADMRIRAIVWKALGEGVAAWIAYGVGAALLVAGTLVFRDPVADVPLVDTLEPVLRAGQSSTPMTALFVCFGMPVVMLIFFLQASIFVGISGRVNHDYDREWWARAGGWLLILAIAWAGLSLITVYGPIALYHAPALLASVGGVSGAIALALGRSAKTPANAKQKEGAGAMSVASNAALGLAVPVFLLVFLSAIALGTTFMLDVMNGRREQREEELLGMQQRAQFMSRADFQTTAKLEGDLAVTVRNQTIAQPSISMATLYGLLHIDTIQKTTFRDVAFLIGLAVGALVLSTLVGVNTFSMHAMYRNRLIRAYLGASRFVRDPDGFTGFDPHDDVQMYQLRHELLWPNAVNDYGLLVKALKGEDAVAKAFRDQLSHWTRILCGMVDAPKLVFALLRIEVDPEARRRSTQDALVKDINRILASVDVAVKIGRSTATMSPLMSVRNRVLFDNLVEDAVEHMIPTNTAERAMLPIKNTDVETVRHSRNPMHVVNVALNLVGGERLAWQQRKAESFTITPLHSGSLRVGYRDTRTYGGAQGITLGTAVAISGAAASPNMGYHSSPALSFLLTMFNVRLGWWLANPGVAGKHLDYANPTLNIAPLTRELLGKTDDTYQWVYLSDGGHFENLALYEMVLRRSHAIVLSDAGCDPKYSFEDLGNAIRKIRIDLGVPIELNKMYMYPRGEERHGKYCAIGTIRYSAVDGPNAVDGKLIYIKPGIYDDDCFPKDVYNYAQDVPDFPHESTGDQFFSESQFESYRALGRHVIDEIIGNYGAMHLAQSRPPLRRTFESLPAFIDAVDQRLHAPKSVGDDTRAQLNRWLQGDRT